MIQIVVLAGDANCSQIALGPVAGPLGRSAYGVRNWEGFSPDPYLTGELFAETIIGLEESGTQACAKHFIGNEQVDLAHSGSLHRLTACLQETQRNPSGFIGSFNPVDVIVEAVSSNIDDQSMVRLMSHQSFCAC